MVFIFAPPSLMFKERSFWSSHIALKGFAKFLPMQLTYLKHWANGF
jgi:hypothetical protein